MEHYRSDLHYGSKRLLDFHGEEIIIKYTEATAIKRYDNDNVKCLF